MSAIETEQEQKPVENENRADTRTDFTSALVIQLNGEPFTLVRGATVANLIESLSLSDKRFAVEINETIIPRSRHQDVQLQKNDRVEVVTAIGGG